MIYNKTQHEKHLTSKHQAVDTQNKPSIGDNRYHLRQSNSEHVRAEKSIVGKHGNSMQLDASRKYIQIQKSVCPMQKNACDGQEQESQVD